MEKNELILCGMKKFYARYLLVSASTILQVRESIDAAAE